MENINLSTFKLSAKQLNEFREIFENYRDDGGPRWSDEEVGEMAIEIISFVLTVSSISSISHQ